LLTVPEAPNESSFSVLGVTLPDDSTTDESVACVTSPSWVCVVAAVACERVAKNAAPAHIKTTTPKVMNTRFFFIILPLASFL
jgi:hypothetical protein